MLDLLFVLIVIGFFAFSAAYVRACARLIGPPSRSWLDLGLDLNVKQVEGPDGPIRLTPTEWQMIELLVRNEGRLVSQRQLLEHIWGRQHLHATNYLRVHMAHICRKLEADPGQPRHFHTEPGMGYRFTRG